MEHDTQVHLEEARGNARRIQRAAQSIADTLSDCTSIPAIPSGREQRQINRALALLEPALVNLKRHLTDY